MKVCGLIVEYNPFHHGHLYHIKESRQKSNADCIIAVMSGPFLQRGEPSLIDKFHRARAALDSGVDAVFELPYAHAVQSSHHFAEGAIKILDQIGANTICFGSESGEISDFLTAAEQFEHHQMTFKKHLKQFLKEGDNYPTASAKAYEAIDLKQFDLIRPNNILGFSYVRAIQHLKSNITPLTIKRIKNDYHDIHINNKIASATSIRREIIKKGYTTHAKDALPCKSLNQIQTYEKATSTLHHWEKYFPFLQYQIISQSHAQLREMGGMNEGLEHRVKEFAHTSENFDHFLKQIKTKRYTQTRLQRIFVHILTQTTQNDINKWTLKKELPYLRLLGMTQRGQAYLNQQKKHISTPIYTNLNKRNKADLYLDEKAQQIYYTIIPPNKRLRIRAQEFQLPIMP